MIPATDSARTDPSRWPLVGLALVALALDPGCARLQSFRKPGETPPAFGTDTAWSASGAKGTIRGSDLYAELSNAPRRPERRPGRPRRPGR